MRACVDLGGFGEHQLFLHLRNGGLEDGLARRFFLGGRWAHAQIDRHLRRNRIPVARRRCELGLSDRVDDEVAEHAIRITALDGTLPVDADAYLHAHGAALGNLDARRHLDVGQGHHPGRHQILRARGRNEDEQSQS